MRLHHSSGSERVNPDTTWYSGKSQSVIGDTTSLQGINRTDIQFNGSDYPYSNKRNEKYDSLPRKPDWKNLWKERKDENQLLIPVNQTTCTKSLFLVFLDF